MDTLTHLIEGFSVAFVPANLLLVFMGALLGTVIGLLPGIGAAAGISILLPVTFGLPPVGALIMLAGVYYGAMYGNTASAVLINTPGTASAAMTTVDGFPMAQKGRGGAALAIAGVASFVAGTLGVIMLSLLAVPFATFAIQFGPAEYFLLQLFGLTAVGMLGGRSRAKGTFSVVLGLMIATVGIDLQSGMTRFTMGVDEFLDGIHFVVVIVGLFAVSESLINVERWFDGMLKPIRIQGKLWFTKDEFKRAIMPIGRGSIIGFLIGVLPGAGGTMATIISYSTEQRISKTPEKFGTGMVEGVAAPEAANNASTSGAFVPLLTLGVPGSGVTAVLLGAFIMFGIQPGPLLFKNDPGLVWGLINSMYLGNLILFLMNVPLIPIFARLLYTPPGLLLSIILAVASIGVFSLSSNTLDVYMIFFFGLLGYTFRKLGVPFAPMVLGLILGGGLEQTFRQALTISHGSPSIFLSSYICFGLMGMIGLVVFGPYIMKAYRQCYGGDAKREA